MRGAVRSARRKAYLRKYELMFLMASRMRQRRRRRHRGRVNPEGSFRPTRLDRNALF